MLSVMERSQPIDIIPPIGAGNTMKALFAKVDFEDTVKLIKDIPELEKLAIKKYNKKIHTLLHYTHCGNLHVVKWIFLHSLESPTQMTIETAAKRGHLEILVWLLQNTPVKCSQRTMDISACNGQFKVVKWIHLNTDIRATPQTIEWANEQGYYTIANWLQENTEDLNSYTGYTLGTDIYNYLKKKLSKLYT
jgi:hypothetical protein